VTGERFVLLSGDVDLWTVSLSGGSDGAVSVQGTLSDEEQQQAGRFRRQIDRRRYVISHGALRDVLARYTGTSPSELRIDRSDAGKPFLAGDMGLRFSLSHSNDRALIAVARGQAVGVDIERIDSETDVLAVAERFFSQQEHQALANTAAPLRLNVFFRLWVCKEAYIKARGESIANRLSEFSVLVADGAGARVLEDRADPEAPEAWTLHLFEVEDASYLAAVALEGPVVHPRVRQWTIDRADRP